MGLERREGQGFRVGKILPAAILSAVAILVVWVGMYAVPGNEEVPAGQARNQAFHVTMRDGVGIAADLWLPADLQPRQRIPALLHMTRYWRATETGILGRVLLALGLADEHAVLPLAVDVFNSAGYAVVLVDARGSGASFGHRIAELSPDEIKDYGEIIDWITEQSWSNGRVGAYGTSYEGITTELVTTTGRSALKAVAPLYTDFDFQLGAFQPGGARLDFIQLWSDLVRHLDRNDICAVNGVAGLNCFWLKLGSPGVKPVDADGDHELLQEAVAEHARNTPLSDALAAVQFIDDEYGDTGLTMTDLNAYGNRGAIERSGVPMHLWVGWIDAASADGALNRFNTFSNPQDLIIAPFSHGGEHDADPFNPPEAGVRPSQRRQLELIAGFFDGHLKKEPASDLQSQITYYVLGASTWCETSTWPPEGSEIRPLHLSADSLLLPESPAGPAKADRYEVDFAHSTGTANRWFTNLDYGDVVYTGREQAGEQLLTYTTKPVEDDLLLAGSPAVTLYLTSTHSDVVIHAYLEAVAPDGTVTYLTEGVLHPQNRKPATPGALPYWMAEPSHSFRRQDALPLVPGRMAVVAFPLYPIAALIPRGFRLRLGIGGADASIFPRVPLSGTPTWDVFRTAGHPSRLDLPVQAEGLCEPSRRFDAESPSY